MAEKKVNIKKLAVGRKDLYELDPKDIYVDPDWNERDLTRADVKDHIMSLALSISEVGVKQPLTVVSKGDKVMLTDGFCRMAAIKIAIEKLNAPIKAVPVRVEDKGSNEADHVLSMLIRNEGKPLNSAEQAKVVKRLLDFGWTKREIADKTGKSMTHIDNCILLLEADPTILAYVKDGDVSARFAVDTIRGKGENALPIITKAIAKAKESGKATATKRNAPKGAKKIQWGTHGPECVSLLEALCDAYDAETSVPDSIADVVNSWRGYKDATNLEVKRPQA